MTESRLTGVDNNAYTYNALGERVEESLSGGASYLEIYYDVLGNRLVTYNRTTEEEDFFAPVGGRNYVKYENSRTDYLHVNALGSTGLVTDQAGNLIQDQLYYPWGQGWENPDEAEDTRFGHLNERDAESGLDPAEARLYSSRLGRWMTPDPGGRNAVHLDDPQTWNMYAYVRNNPTTLTDPSGLLVQCSSSLNKKDAATCQGIIDTANRTDKKGNYLYPKLHDVYKRLNDDKRIFVIDNAKLPGREGAVFNVRQINASRTDFASGTIQIDFAKIRNTPAVPADMVPGFTKYAGMAGDFGLKLAETFGHEGTHGVYALDNLFQAVAAQSLRNDSEEILQMPGGNTNPELSREQAAFGIFFEATETYAQQTEQIINQELNGGPDE